MRSKGAINNYVAYRIREVRNARKLSSQEVARKTGIAPGSYSCLENGWYNINLDNLFKILQALEADVQDVWPKTEEPACETIDESYLLRAAQCARRFGVATVELDDIYESVCRAFELGKDMLHSRSRGWKRLREARAACAMLVKEAPNLSLTSLSRSLGCSLSSMSHLARRYEPRFEEEGELVVRMRQARRELQSRLEAAS